MMREMLIGCAVAGGALYLSNISPEGNQHTEIHPPLSPVTPTVVSGVPSYPPLPDYQRKYSTPVELPPDYSDGDNSETMPPAGETPTTTPLPGSDDEWDMACDRLPKGCSFVA